MVEKIRLSIATTDKLGKPEYQYQHFYRAAEVDALLKAAGALVEAVVEDHPHLENSPQGEKCPICQAIAAVEAIISPPRSSPPPEGNGKA